MISSFLWLFAALTSSVLSAQNVEMNRRAKQEGFRLNLWRMSMSSLFWLPLALLQKWPTEPLFYATAVFCGLALMIGFTIQTDLAVKHNGRVAILHMPMKAMVVFVLWGVMDGATKANMVAHPWHVVGEVMCLGAMVGALLSFRKHDVSWSSFKAVLPIVVLYAAGDIITRLTLSPQDLAERLVVFMFMVSSASAVISVLLLPWRPQPQLPLITPTLIRCGGWAAFGSTLSQTCFFIALILGPSPAYVSMVALLAPVWLLIYHRMAKVKDDASPLAGTVLVAAAFVLMALSAS